MSAIPAAKPCYAKSAPTGSEEVPIAFKFLAQPAGAVQVPKSFSQRCREFLAATSLFFLWLSIWVLLKHVGNAWVDSSGRVQVLGHDDGTLQYLEINMDVGLRKDVFKVLNVLDTSNFNFRASGKVWHALAHLNLNMLESCLQSTLFVDS